MVVAEGSIDALQLQHTRASYLAVVLAQPCDNGLIAAKMPLVTVVQELQGGVVRRL
jgi:hypothetical protein